MAVEAAVSMAEGVAVASMGAEARIAVALEKLMQAAPTARDLMAEEVTAEAADLKLAAIQAHRRRDRQNVLRQLVVRSIAVLRIFVPPSTMASGIRLAMPPVPRGLRVQAQDAIPPVPSTPLSWLVTPEFPMAVGTLLVHPVGACQELRPASQAEPAALQPLIAAALALETVSAVAGVAVASASASAGEGGALASDGRSGALTGDPTPGIPGGITLTATIHTGIPCGQPITIIRMTATTGPPIRPRTGPRMTTTSQQATRVQYPAHRILRCSTPRSQ